MNILFDLDGTLSDSKNEVTRCLAYALNSLQVAVPERAILERYLGPPLRDCFASLLATDDKALIERAVLLYREHFADVGIREAQLYPGASNTLAQLKEDGHKLFLATSKAEINARRTVQHLGIECYFVAAYGDTLAGERPNKTSLIAHILKVEELMPTTTVMVGDRDLDALGARANGVRSIGVLWGYGTPEELRKADHTVDSWSALLHCLEDLSRNL